jgi:hypothetical protein
MIEPAKCYCGSASWERKLEDNRFICCSCKRPLWQPIETAPKTGVPILAIVKWDMGDNNDRNVDIIEWDEEAKDWFCHNGGWLKQAYVHATHWMPLPEPPK